MTCSGALDIVAPAPEVRKVASILFADLKGSTELGERLDAEAVRAVVRSYFEEARTLLEGHGGTVEKFIGDAVMAVFGVPISHEDDALRAVQAGLAMQELLTKLNEGFRERWGAELQIRIGVNTGELVAGDPSAGQAFVYGDAVNVAARLEQAAAPGDVLIGPMTFRLVRHLVGAEAIEPLALKGKSEPMPAYRVRSRVDRTAPSQLRAPLVGREEEIERLLSAMADVVARDRMRLVSVIGSPGIGKSRLLDEFLASVGGATILRARCLPEVERTHAPLTELLGGILSVDAQTEELHQAVIARIAGHGRSASVARGVVLAVDPSGEGPREEALWALRELLVWESRSRPVIVFLDDAHWADEGSIELVQYLVARPEGAAVLVLLAARPEFLEDRSEWRNDDTIRLEPLSPKASVDLLEGALGGGLLGEDLEARITGSADGNPLFLEQIVRMLVDEGTLVRGDDGWTTKPGRLNVAVPDGITALLQARLDQLSSDARRILESAAVVGNAFSAEAVASLVSSALRAEVGPLLRDLIDREFVRADDLSATGDFRFHHALLRDAAYAAITKASRAELHETLAGWLDGQGRAAETIGGHLERAALLWTEIVAPGERERGIARRAAVWLARAAGEAADQGQREATVERFLRARRMVIAEGSGDEVALAMTGHVAARLGDWDAAIELLGPLESSSDPLVVKDLGLALTRRHRDDRDGEGFRRGHALLERAAELDPIDADALASLAGAWRGADDERAHMLYRRALERDGSDPYALGNHVEYEISRGGDLSVLDRLRPQLTDALDRRREQAAANEDSPWCHYDVGRFSLILGDAHGALNAYAMAFQRSPSEYMVETSLASLIRLAPFEDALAGLTWCKRLLQLGLGATFRNAWALGELGEAASRDHPALQGPIVIVAGGTSPETQERVRSYGSSLAEGLADFGGTIISGGTTQGVPALVGDVGKELGIRTVGVLPERLPLGVAADMDTRRYTELRRTAGSDFTPLEPLQYWTDLIANGSSPDEVRLIGIGGGRIAAGEFRIALALGAKVGVVRGSGREADELLDDFDWASTERLADLSPSRSSIRAFLQS